MMNEPRQVRHAISPTTSGGANAFPMRAKECVMPCAKPRFAAGVQFDIARVAVGKVAPSPIPRRSRAAKSDQRPPTNPVRMVEPAQIKPERVSVLRGPNLSAMKPPETCRARYAYPNAENASPSCVLESLKSLRIGSAAVARLTRSMYVIRYIRQSRNSTNPVADGLRTLMSPSSRRCAKAGPCGASRFVFRSLLSTRRNPTHGSDVGERTLARRKFARGTARVPGFAPAAAARGARLVCALLDRDPLQRRVAFGVRARVGAIAVPVSRTPHRDR